MLKNVGLNLLSEGKTIRIKAHGYSMYPSIKPGSVILIEPITLKGPPVPGEIIAIKRESGLIVHRLVRILKNEGTTLFIARGDSNARTDDPVNISMIAGRIISADSGSAHINKNQKQNYVINRLRVIWIILLQRIKKRT